MKPENKESPSMLSRAESLVASGILGTLTGSVGGITYLTFQNLYEFNGEQYVLDPVQLAGLGAAFLAGAAVSLPKVQEKLGSLVNSGFNKLSKVLNLNASFYEQDENKNNRRNEEP